jgi:enamine deaminase RidA (YjgF/YER057c/UK114 family)
MDDQTPQIGEADPMAAQVALAWEQMLTIATAQGFTREQIMVLTIRTAMMILSSTRDALWSQMKPIPVGETEAASMFRSRIRDLDRNARTLVEHFEMED